MLLCKRSFAVRTFVDRADWINEWSRMCILLCGTSATSRCSQPVQYCATIVANVLINAGTVTWKVRSRLHKKIIVSRSSNVTLTYAPFAQHPLGAELAVHPYYNYTT